jgi:hypothetical protein
MKKIIISLGLVCSGLFFVSAQTAPLSPSNVILSAPISTATSSATPIKYTIRWRDNAENESNYFVQLLDYNTKIPISGATVNVGANATSAYIYAKAVTFPVYAFVSAGNEFGGNGTTSNVLDGAVFSYLKSVFSLGR